ncbi:MAG: alpha/beta hydrolase, partial [Pseudomonadota bacterium]|nr:alpha/beta hydrolase [Pseudomonadota bacterium]
PGPVLVIGGEQDRYTPPEETRALYAAAPGPKALWLVPQGGQGELGNLSDAPTRERVRQFLNRTIGPP